MMGGEQEESGSLVVGRVVQGLNSVVGYLVRAKMTGTTSRQFIAPLKISRVAQVFEQDVMPRPALGSSNNNTNNGENSTSSGAPVVSKKKGSLLDSMFD